MVKDSFGLEITTDSSVAVDAINNFVDQLFSVGNDAQVILKAVEADPACAMANAQVAAFYLFAGGSFGFTQATSYLYVAKANLKKANEREKLYVAAIEAWANRDIQEAIAHHEAITDSYPRDLASVHLAQYHYRNSGNSQGLLGIAEKVFAANEDNPYIYGMLAFGLEECHRIPEAETYARLAIALKRDNRWAHHAIAHVLETAGRLEEGITLMESLSDTWEFASSAFYGHLWWHTSLYYLDLENFAKVLEIYDTRIWGRAKKDNGREQINAIALLLRLELRGVDVGSRWQELASYLQPRLHEHVLAFLDLQYIYALVRGGKEDWAGEMLESMQDHAEKVLPYVRRTWAEIGVPAAQGMIAHARGDWGEAIAQLEPVLPELQSTGGSHAQRDLFEQIYLDALIHQRQYHKALNVLEKRQVARDNIPGIQRQLANTYSQLGRTNEAHRASQRALELSQRYQKVEQTV
ncbi:tetratricopeptide repeat protein [Nostoc sp. C117]|uniref:tetratricopeptide repeat protein n=1 Tax=Nostoc sp. C117 TaxID=3349875 RepID=UPI00370DA46D